ncbi:Ppx/GppA phosphatase family protein [Sediminitomix flava]|uniref:Exopolyphosphatase/guanosine-5'-triphosphate, 3'-diphosphate pyrophosphatase n=1 Tax=Sediminitomix flava TaxID=379075 RepID=A0A315ZCB2_SEDFL|nr:phosphatase [Sediminitomix flava]PWJ42960.1 exopolyphosphatase/guanosine-5'-triphosphate,3'-diphosphate pyrophosphatase [Sediminitomix flava]
MVYRGEKLNKNKLRLASIDIGSNAIRLQVIKVLGEGKDSSIKKVEFLRFPLRLGNDVFSRGRITRPTEEKFVKLMHTFQNLMDLYEVTDYRAYATSAMREAENGEDIVQRVYYQLGLMINIIDGKKEAEIINLSIDPYLNDEDNFIHIDVGGGSTELNLYRGKKKLASKSYRMGGVRRLDKAAETKVYEKMDEWIKEYLPKNTPIKAVGTGGNINKLFKLSKDCEREDKVTSLDELIRLRNYIREFSMVERINTLRLNKDRADVIIPASRIYTTVMELSGAEEIIVPSVGLKDGIILEMLEDMENAQKFADSE